MTMLIRPVVGPGLHAAPSDQPRRALAEFARPVDRAMAYVFGMPTTIAIQVPVGLRDRLAAVADRERTTLAGAIERSLDLAEEAGFWARAAATMGKEPHSAADRVDVEGALTDGLDPNESWDDVFGRCRRSD